MSETNDFIKWIKETHPHILHTLQTAYNKSKEEE